MVTKSRAPRTAPTIRQFPYLENRQRRLSLSLSLPALCRFQQRLNRLLGLRDGSSFVCFLTDSEMKALNRRFRRKPGTTDVLSFPSETRSPPKSLKRRTIDVRGAFLGDIAISPSVAQRNACRFRRTLSQEICILMLHGLLHLLGYDHDTDHGQMERLEATLRRQLGLT